MADVFPKEKRSDIMSRIRSQNTKPEILVRKLLHRMGYRFRLRRKDLPGCPDIALPRHRKVVFVHGCFWHGHEGCRRSKRPTTNTEFWNRKIDGNLARDAKTQADLTALGWSVLVVWQCEIRDKGALQERLRAFMRSTADR